MQNAQSSQIKKQIMVLQILYWMAFCSISGFATVYLLSKNITNGQIGMIIATGNFLSVIAQSLIGVVVDKYETLTLQKVMLFFLVINTGLIGSLLFIKNDFLMTVLYCLSFVFLMNLQPLVTSFIYDYINSGVNTSFSFSRGMGSLAYATFSFFMGQWLENHSANSIPVASLVLTLLLFGIVAFMPQVKEVPLTISNVKKETATNLKDIPQKYPNLLLLLVGILFLFTFHTIINVFLPQIIETVYGGQKEVGFAIALAALCELPMMFGFQKLENRFGVVKLLKISALFFFIKSILYLIASSFIFILGAQLLQSLSFAIITPALAHYINITMAEKDQVKGQSFIMASVTSGNVLGSLVGGWLLDISGVSMLLLFGVIASFVGMIILHMSIQKRTSTGASIE